MARRLKYETPGVHFAVFFGLAVGMYILNYIVTTAFFGDVTNVIAAQKDLTPEMVSRFKLLQFIGSTISFLLPPVLYAYMSSDRPWHHIGLRGNVRVLPAFASVLLLFAVLPLTMLLGTLNEHVDFGTMQNLVRKIEDFYEKIMSQLLVMDGPMDLMINLVVMALLPAIGEELFFRGCLQNILEKWTRSAVLSIGLASLGFALLHGTIFKLLPIFVLGIVLGTIFYVTRNLWYCILFHFLNNGFALIATYYAQRNEFMKKLAEDDVQISWWTGFVSLLVVVGIFVFLRKRMPYQPPETALVPSSAYNEPPSAPR